MTALLFGAMFLLAVAHLVGPILLNFRVRMMPVLRRGWSTGCEGSYPALRRVAAFALGVVLHVAPVGGRPVRGRAVPHVRRRVKAWLFNAVLPSRGPGWRAIGCGGLVGQ